MRLYHFYHKVNHSERDWRQVPQKPRQSFIFILLAFAIVLFIGLSGCRQGEQGAEEQEKFSVSVPVRPGYTALFVGMDKGYFQEEGLDVSLKPVPTGQAGLESLFAGEVQAAGAADTPIARSVVEGDDKIAVIATIAEVQQATVIVAKKDSGIAGPGDLKGKVIGVTRGTGAEYFLHFYLVANNVDPSEVQTVYIKPERIVTALLEGEVEAVSAWSPHKLILLEKLGPDANILTDQALHLQTFNLATTWDFTINKPETIRKFLRGVLRANSFIKMNPDESQMILSKYIGADIAFYQKEWSDYSFTAVLDQSLILNLENQARWMLNQTGDPGETPNFMEYIDVHPLENVQPQAVRILGSNSQR